MEFICVCADDDEEDHIDAKVKAFMAKDLARSKYILGALAFFALNRHRPGIFVASFLLLHGWKERDIGLILFMEGITCLCVQTPIGQFIDYTCHKKLVVAVSSVIISLTSIMLVYSTDFNIVFIALCIQAVGISLGFPAIYALTLGMVGTKGIMQQVPVNEEATHAGNAFYALAACILASYGGGVGLFWFCSVMGLCCCLVLCFIDESQINHDRARGFETPTSQTKLRIPMSLTEFFGHVDVFTFYVCIFLFHLSNASMLPLLSQHLAMKNMDKATLFTAFCIIVAQLTMVLVAALCECLIPIVGKKNLLTFGIGVLPIRGACIIALFGANMPPYILILTQVLDGIAGGILGVIAVLIVEDLTRDTGRFSLAVGTIKTMESLGFSLSTLIGEAVADFFGYDVAFCILSVIALGPMLIVWFQLPDVIKSVAADTSGDCNRQDSASSLQSTALSLQSISLT